MNRSLRLIPVVLFALVSLLLLRLLALSFSLAPPNPGAQDTGERFAKTMTRTRENGLHDPLITGSISGPDITSAIASKDAPPPAKEAGERSKAQNDKIAHDKLSQELLARAESPGQKIIPPTGPEKASESRYDLEIAEKLKERSREIEAREREMEMRDTLLRASEHKLDERITSLRTLENAAGLEGGKAPPLAANLRPLVVMYEAMKPKDAARVFDRLDRRVLVELVQSMNPRRMAEILAAMDPAAAERLTVALAQQADKSMAQAKDTREATYGEGELPRLPLPKRP